MSNGMNKVILLGNLGREPILRYSGAGIPVLSFSLATTEAWTDKNQQKQERTEWHNVVLWGPRAEPLSKLLNKGASVLVEGGLRTSSYEKDGQKRTKTEVHARDILFAGRRPAAPGAPDAANPDPAKQVPRVPQLELDELPY
jgi:single-strand DNA-binding protein